MSFVATYHECVEGTATTSEVEAAFLVDYIEYVQNDGAANLIVNFGNAGLTGQTAASNKLTVKPGEIRGPLHLKAKACYYKSASGTVDFRICGLRGLKDLG